jgi:manganese efflux pump family protein
MLRLIAFVLPLGLDSFAVAAAIGATGRLPGRTRLRISLLFMAFEAGMPLLGLAGGAPLARAIGGVADYVAVAAVIGVGVWILLREESEESEGAARLVTATGWAALGLGISISLDELAIGFSLGLTRLPILPVIVAIAAQAFLAAQVGLRLGSRIGERLREGAEQLAGVALIAVGLFLLGERLFHR